MRDLNGRVAVVTGAGSGIGRATSEALARAGCHVAAVDIDAAALAATEASLGSLGVSVSSHVLDVANPKRMQALPEAVLAQHPTIDIVVNNAGVSVTAPFLEQSTADLEWIVGINLWGVIYGCKYFIPHLLRAPEGHIVNLSSVFGLIGLPGQSSYAMTKFAVRGFSESLRAELAPLNIGVTSVHPGAVRTNIVRSARMSGDGYEHLRQKTMDWFERNAVSPEHAARLIVKGIQRNTARVLITPEAYLLDAIKRLFPVSGNALAGLLARDGGLLKRFQNAARTAATGVQHPDTTPTGSRRR